MFWLLLYAAILFAGCLWHAHYRTSCVSFYVCDRQARAPAVALSLLASCIGGSATIGMTGLAWECGTPAFWWLGSGAIGLFLLGCLLAAKIRSTNALTMPGVIVIYLGRACQQISALIILASSLAVAGAQVSALGIMINSIADCGYIPAACAGTAFLLLYTYIGGQSAVIRSDIWQFLILACALLLALCLLLNLPPCLERLAHIRLQIANENLPPGRVIYFLLIFGSSFLIGPMIFGRILSASSPKAARLGSLWAALGMALTAVVITCLGIALQGLPISPPAREDALFTGIAQALPPWAQLCVTLGLISAVVSSADSCLMTAATVCASALLRQESVPLTRACICILSALALGLALTSKGILALLLAASDIFVCGVVPPLLIALLTCPALHQGRPFYLGAMISGGSFGLLAALAANPAFSFAGMGCALLLSSLGAIAEMRQARACSLDQDQGKS